MPSTPAKKKLTRRDRFLAEIAVATPWLALMAANLLYYLKRYGRGRPPSGVERVRRTYIAQQCFGSSEEGVKEAIYDSQAIRRFVGTNQSHQSAPDATRRLLEQGNLPKGIFNACSSIETPLSGTGQEHGAAVFTVCLRQFGAGAQGSLAANTRKWRIERVKRSHGLKTWSFSAPYWLHLSTSCHSGAVRPNKSPGKRG